MGVFGIQDGRVRGLAAALCVAGVAACASAPPMQPTEIAARVGDPEDQARYPAIVLDQVTGFEAEVFAAALRQAMADHGIGAGDETKAARRLSIEVTRLDEDVAETEVRVEMDAAFAFSPSDDHPAARTVFRELAIRTIPGGREADEIFLNNAARAATQIAAAVASAGVAVPSIVTPHVRVPSEYRALRAAKQDAIAGIIRQFLTGLSQR
jgi:hypothetical protein